MISWIQPSRFGGGGGGGGGTPTLIAGASLATNYSTNNGTTGSFSAAGTNTVVFGATVGREPSSPSPTLSDCKYGGSGGTSMTLMTSSDRQFYADSSRAGRYIALPGPGGSTTIYATFGSASLGSIIQGCAFENVSGYSDQTGNNGNSTASTVTASVTVPNTTAGDICVAHFACGYGNNDGVDFDNTGITDSIIITQPASGESKTWTNGIWVMKEATGSTCTLQINCIQTSSADLFWDAYGFKLTPA